MYTDEAEPVFFACALTFSPSSWRPARHQSRVNSCRFLIVEQPMPIPSRLPPAASFLPEPKEASESRESLPTYAQPKHLHAPHIGLPGAPPRRSSAGHARTRDVGWTPKHSDVLKAAHRIAVIGWSSMGLGHTGRSFEPLRLAVQDGTLKAGDVVVVSIPVPWGDEQKRLSANTTLNDFRLFLEKKGIKVAFFRTDRSIRADYKGDNPPRGRKGDSDNHAAMTSLALQPYRYVPPPRNIDWDKAVATTSGLSKEKIDETVLEAVPVVSEKNLLLSLCATVNHVSTPPEEVENQLKLSAYDIWEARMRDGIEGTDLGDWDEAKQRRPATQAKEICVLDDMSPFLAGAARELGLHSVSQSNHANLFSLPKDDSPEAVQEAVKDNRKKFMWAKMQYGGEGHLQAEISPQRNTLTPFAGTAQRMKTDPRFGFDETTSKADAREKVIRVFMEDGVRIPLDKAYEGGPGIIFAEGRVPKNIVLLYVQDLTPRFIHHIQGRFLDKEGARFRDDYHDTMFVVCKPGSFTTPINALQVGMFANAGIVMAGGYGTTSEAWYAAENGHQGLVTVVPVPYQREQEANANKLKDVLGDRVRILLDPRISREPSGHPYADLDEMVAEGTRQHLTGDMKYLFDAIEAPGSNAEHTKKLLFGQAPPTDTEVKMNVVLGALRADTQTKAMRRLTAKVLVPLFNELVANNGLVNLPFTFKMTAKADPVGFSNLGDVMEVLNDEERLGRLLDVPINSNEATDIQTGLFFLQELKDKAPEEVVKYAQDALHRLSSDVLAGSCP